MFEFIPSDSLVHDLAGHRAWVFWRQQRLDETPTHKPHFLESVSEARIREAVKIRFTHLLGAIATRAQRGSVSETVLIEAGKFAPGFDRALRAELRLKNGRAGDALMFRMAREVYYEIQKMGNDVPLNAQQNGLRIVLRDEGCIMLRVLHKRTT